MDATITELITSAFTLTSSWLIGNKSVWGQRIGMIANLCWWFYIISFKRWGLAPMEVAFTFMQVRNLIKWEKEYRDTSIRKCGKKGRTEVLG